MKETCRITNFYDDKIKMKNDKAEFHTTIKGIEEEPKEIFKN